MSRSTDRKTILVVEDDFDIRSNMIEILEFEGYATLSAQNGREALDLLLDESKPLPCLIALDLYMPVMDGREFLHQLRTLHERDLAHVSVILISAADPATRADLEGKTIGTLRKPIDIDKFLSIVEQHSRAG